MKPLGDSGELQPAPLARTELNQKGDAKKVISLNQKTKKEEVYQKEGGCQQKKSGVNRRRVRAQCPSRCANL